MKKFAAMLCVVCLLLSVSAVADTWKGWVSDEKCGAKINAACAKKCIDGGSKAVFVNEADKSVVAIHNQDAVKGHEGHHVQVTGTITDGQLHIDSVAMLPEQEKAPGRK